MRGFSVIALDNPKDEANVGGVLRAAHCFGASMVVLGGKRPARMKHAEDTTKAWRHMPVCHHEDLLSVIPYDCVPVAVEIMETKVEMLPDFQHPERAFYIFGPEDGSVQQDILERCAKIVQIPTAYCLNLAATVNVVLYDRLAKLGKMAGRIVEC